MKEASTAKTRRLALRYIIAIYTKSVRMKMHISTSATLRFLFTPCTGPQNNNVVGRNFGPIFGSPSDTTSLNQTIDSMNKYVSQQGKQLLKNTIQSSNSQNKILEQNLMWKMHENIKRTYSSQDSGYEDANRRMKRKKLTSNNDDDYDLRPSSSSSSSSKNGDKNYWMKKLVKEEEKLPDRWGHNGYKELYPEDFQSDRESIHSFSDSEISTSSSSSCSSSKKKKTKKRKKSKSKKEKRKKSKKKHKKHRRK